MKARLFCILFFSLLIFNLHAQKNNQYTKVSDSDPKATKILDGLKKEYDTYKTSEVSFELEIEIPGRGKETQKGKFIQSGKKFAVNLDEQEIYCDGKTVWMYIKSNKEVQINNYEEGNMDEMMMSPKELFKLYKSGKYIYAISGSENINGINATLIEFKPTDKNDPYSKLRMAIDTKNNKPINMKAFGKDGSKYILTIKNVVPNKNYSNDTFVFNAKKYPGVRIEDLRID